ncbi:MAG: branched-chain amino acid ABC transporter permease [Acidimicrobiales bacterium]
MSFLIQLLLHPEAWYHAHELLAGQLGVDGLLALSLWLTLYSGQLTLANAGFMAIGAYTSVILNGGTTSAGRVVPGLSLPFPVATAAGMLLAAVAAVVIGVAVVRLRGVFLAIATIGFGEALRFGVILNLGITGKGEGLNNPHAALTSGIGPIWLSLLVLAYAGWRLTGSKTGVAWAAIREDERAAAAQGIDVTRYKLAAFVLGAMVASYAGALSAHLSFLVDNGDYSFSLAINILIWAVVGGIAFVIGPIIGAILLNILPEVLRFAQSYRNVIDGVILIGIVIYLPDGLFHRRTRRGRPRWWPARWWPARWRPTEPAPQPTPP